MTNEDRDEVRQIVQSVLQQEGVAIDDNTVFPMKDSAGQDDALLMMQLDQQHQATEYSRIEAEKVGGGGEPIIDAYTKQESDAKYQPKGNYQPAGDYATKTELNGKVDKVSGKGLSTNDYTNEDKTKVAAAITEHQDISGKVDKIAGKGLSTNDYTNAEKQKVANALVPADIAGKANASDVYAKSETYNKTELNNMITTPEQKYVTVTATAQTTAVIDLLPATGVADTVYRVGCWDGTQYDDTCYSEYAWKGDAYSKLDTKNVGIDDEPTTGSNNLVKSGGVAGQISVLQKGLEIRKINITSVNLVDASQIEHGYGLYLSNGEKAVNQDLCVSGFIPVNDNVQYNGFANAYWSGWVYDKTSSPLRAINSSTAYTYQSGDAYIRLVFLESTNNKRANFGNALLPYTAYNPIDGYTNDIKESINLLAQQEAKTVNTLGRIDDTQSFNSGVYQLIQSDLQIKNGDKIRIKVKSDIEWNRIIIAGANDGTKWLGEYLGTNTTLDKEYTVSFDIEKLYVLIIYSGNTQPTINTICNFSYTYETDKKIDNNDNILDESIRNKAESKNTGNLVDVSKCIQGYGLYANTGVEAPNASLCISDYIPVKGKNIVSNAYFTTYWGGAVYDVNKNILRALGTNLYTYQEGDCYIRLSFSITEKNKTANYGSTILPQADYNPIIGYCKSLFKYDRFHKETNDITNTIEFVNGSMNLDGTVNPSTDYRHTEKIAVSEGDMFVTDSNLPYRLVTAFSGTTAVAAKGGDSVSVYVVPEGIDGIVITLYVGQSEIATTIVATQTEKTDDRIVELEKCAYNNYMQRQPRVTIIDDDGNVEFYQYLLPIMKAKGVPMVSAYMGDRNFDMKSNTDMMTAEQCKEVVDNGGEIIVHYQPSLTSLTLTEAEKVVLLSKEVLRRNGFNSELIAYSNGTCNPSIRAMISKHFKAGFTGSYPRVSDTERSNVDCIPQYFIHREHAGGLYYSTEATTLSYFKALIDECIAANGWLVLITHSWLMPEGQREPAYENIDQFGLLEDVIDYIKSKEASTGIKIVTATEGLEMFGNVFQSGDYMGYWNEQTIPVEGSEMMGGHFVAGCAINKVGQWDFPNSGRIIHT